MRGKEVRTPPSEYFDSLLTEPYVTPLRELRATCTAPYETRERVQLQFKGSQKAISPRPPARAVPVDWNIFSKAMRNDRNLHYESRGNRESGCSADFAIRLDP